MSGVDEAAYSSRGRRLFPTRGGRGAAAATRRGRGAATAPPGGSGAAVATRRGRGAATASPGGSGAAAAPRGGSGGSSRSGSCTPQPSRADDVEREAEGEEEEQHPEAEGEEDEHHEVQEFWMREPANLPRRPTREEEKTVIVPVGDTQWREEGGGDKCRLPNGIIGVLLRWHFPGLVTYRGRREPAWTWCHYKAAADIAAAEGEVPFDSCLQQVEESFWWWFRWADGQEADSKRVLRNCVKKLIPQMFYEARIQAVICYHTQVLGQQIRRAEACRTHITLDEYMQAIPWWALKCEDAWQQIARERWCNERWLQDSRAARERRLLMDGTAHRQGSSSMTRYKKNLEKKKQRLVSDMEAYLEARRGDQEGTLCSQRATEQHLAAYTDAAKEIHGPEYDVMNSPLDASAVYKAGKGKKYGRFFMGAGYISTPTTLSEVRSTSAASTDEVHLQSRQTGSHGLHSKVSELEVQLRQEIEARQRLEQMLVQALGSGTRLHGPPSGEPLPHLSAPGTAGSVASTANPEDAGANVEDHVNASIAERPPPEL